MVDVNVFGTAPGTFQLYNHKDTALDLPLSRNEGEDYPLWLGRVENMVGDVQRLDKVRYVTVRNNTVDKFGTYNFTLSTHIAGRVGMGKSIEVQPNHHLTEIELDITKEGPLALVYDTPGAILQQIRDPDGNTVPLVTSREANNAAVMVKSMFISAKKGIYSAYFTMTEKYITVKLEDLKTNGYKFNETVRVDDPEYKTGELPTYSELAMDIYTVNVKAGQIIKSYFKTILGNQDPFFSFPAGNGYSTTDLPAMGAEESYVLPKDGVAYLWVFKYLPCVGDPTPDSYRFVLTDLYVEEITPSDTSNRIIVTPSGADTIRGFKVTVENTGTLLFNHTVIQNAPMIQYVNTPAGFLYYIGNNSARLLAPILTPPYPSATRDHCYYHVEPGTYYFRIFSTSTTEEGVVDMRIRYFADAAINLAELEPGQVSLNTDQMEAVTLTNMDNDTLGFGATFIKVFKFTMPVYTLATTLTVTINGTDNGAFFNHGTTLAGSYKGNFFYKSPYDGVYLITSGGFSDSFSFALTGSDTATYNQDHLNFEARTFYMSFVMHRLRDGSNASAIVKDDITVKFGLGHRNSERIIKNYDMSANIANNTVNTTIYSGYNAEESVNASLINGILWKVTGAKQFDWIQINSQRLNGQASSYRLQILYNAPWYSHMISPSGMDYLSPSSSAVNKTIEVGALTTNFYVYVPIAAADPAVNVVNNIWIGGYNIPIINPSMQQPEPGTNWLMIGLIIGGVVLGVVAVVVIVFVVRKKKRGY
jgi:hypothetical protein